MVAAYFFTLLPVLVFAIIDYYSADLKRAVFAGALCVLLEVLISYLSSGRIDPTSVTLSFLFIALGGLSIAYDDTRYIKLQPAPSSLIAALFFAYLRLRGEPFLVEGLSLLPDTSPEGDLVEVAQFLISCSIALLLLNALWVAYAALYCRQATWVLVNVFGVWLLFGTALLLWAAYSLLGPRG